MPILSDTKDYIGHINPVVKMSATNPSEEIHIALLKKSQDFKKEASN